jgi:hypothetical protein
VGTILTLMIGASVLVCSGAGSTSTQPDRFWADFSPSYANFQQHFDANLDALDPVEGIWVAGQGHVAIIRSNIFEGFDYVAVALEAVEGNGRRFTRGEIAIALRNAPGNMLYGFQCASTLRAEACSSLPCDGAIVIAEGTMRAQSGLMVRGECTPDNWLRRHPSR